MHKKQIKDKINFLKWRIDNLTNDSTKKLIIQHHGIAFYQAQINEILDELIRLRNLL